MFGRKKNGYRKIEERVDALKSDFDSLQQNLRGLATGAQEAVRARTADLLKNSENLEEWTNENVDSLRDMIREQPLASCILSLSAGALLGALMLRR